MFSSTIARLRRVRQEIAETRSLVSDLHASVAQQPTIQEIAETTARSLDLRSPPALQPSGDPEDFGAPFQNNRKAVAWTYLKGSGIEVGALHQPLAVPPGVLVRYVDRMSAADLRTHYPELADLPLIDADVVDDGQTLSTFADASVDFVVANHFIEHCADPIRTIGSLCRVTRTGGVIYMAVPDMRYTFDRGRALTSFEHMAEDYEKGPDGSRRGHFEEVVQITEQKAGDEALRRTETLLAMDYSIHYHTFTHHSLLHFMTKIQERYNMKFEVEFAMRNGMESILVLRVQ